MVRDNNRVSMGNAMHLRQVNEAAMMCGKELCTASKRAAASHTHHMRESYNWLACVVCARRCELTDQISKRAWSIHSIIHSIQFIHSRSGVMHRS